MKRMLLVLAVALVMAAMVAVMAAPAMATNRCGGHGWHFDKQTEFCVFRNG
jgi:Spy/CpxP family protein refolding chaperone